MSGEIFKRKENNLTWVALLSEIRETSFFESPFQVWAVKVDSLKQTKFLDFDIYFDKFLRNSSPAFNSNATSVL